MCLCVFGFTIYKADHVFWSSNVVLEQLGEVAFRIVTLSPPTSFPSQRLIGYGCYTPHFDCCSHLP